MRKSAQRIAAWLLAASMVAGTFVQPMAVYAESTVSVADGTTAAGDIITADGDVVIGNSAGDADLNADTNKTADVDTPAEDTTAADADAPTEDGATTTDADTSAEDDTLTITPTDLQSCMALLSVSELALDADSIAPEVRDETMALEDEITVNSADTLQALVNAAVLKDSTATNITVTAEPNHAYTGTLVIPDGTLLGTNEDGTPFKVDYTGKTITLNMNGSTLTVPNDAAVGVSVFGKLTIQNGTIKAAENCTATRGAQVPLGGNLTLDNTTISGFHYAGPGAGVYVKGTAAINSNGSFDVMLDDTSAPVKDKDGNYKIKKVQGANSTDMDTYFTMQGTSRIENCVSNGSGAALYAHNAAVVTLTGATFAGNKSADNGGAVYLGTGVALTLADGVVFDGNHSAMDGGALYLANQYDLQVKTETVKVQVPVVFSGSKDDDVLHGAKFTKNTADGKGGALAFDAQFNGLADKTIRYATFADNTAMARGGAIAFNEGIVQNTLDTCAFTNNRAICGGAVYYPNMIKEGEERTPDYNITNSAFEGNNATDDNGLNGYGGAVLLQMNHSGTLTTNHTASLHIQGSTFTGNRASFSGGAVAAWKEGGDTRAIRMQVTLDGNTFTGNRTTADTSKVTWAGGGAVYLYSNAVGTFTANTFTDNSSACRGGAVYMLNDRDIEDRVHTFGALGQDGKPDPAKANTFTGNHADAWGGAIFDGVSSEAVYGETTKTLIYGGTFQNNTTYSAGGAIYFSNKREREDDAILFDGVTFTGNEAQRTGSGGALYLSDSRVAIRNSIFTGNKTELNAGGAIYASYTDNLTVKDTNFEGNIAGNVRQNDARGGAIFVTRGGVQLENDTFTKNEGSTGGAISTQWDYGTQLAIKNCQFTENKATGSGGALYSYGSTVEVWDSHFADNSAANGGAVCMSGRYNIKPYYATLTVHEGCTFTNNCVTGHGGAIYMENSSGTSYTDDDGELKYYHNAVNILGTKEKPVTFTDNQATSGHGGVLRMGNRVDLTVDYATFDNNSCGNSTGYAGGVIYAGACDTVKLTNSTFTNNSTTGSGGVLYADGVLQYVTINGVTEPYSDPENITVENCSFTGNSAGSNGGVIATGGDLRGDSTRYKDLVGNLTLNNNTFDGNHAGSQGGALYIHSNWEGKIDGGSITNNTAGTNGGALFVRRSHVSVDGGAVIDGNTAGSDGGAIYVGYEWGDTWKDNTYPDNSVTTKNCTISHNTAQRGGVAFVQSYAGFAMEKTTQVEGNIGTGDVYVCANARKVTLAKAAELQGEYTAWRMDDTEDLTDTVINEEGSSKDHYYNLLGNTRYVARLNGGLLGLFGEEKFATLQDAINAAQKRGKASTIDLLADVNEKVTANTENGAITLNLNHYTLSGSINLNNAANNNAFTLTDEAKADAKEKSAAGLFTGTGDGIVMGIGHAQDAPNTLVLKNVTLSNFQRAVKGSNYTSVTADGATFEKYYFYGIRVGDKSRITVKNSTFRDSTTSTYYNSHALSVEGQQNTVTIEDGKFSNLTAQYGPAVYMNYNNTLTINGGEFYNNTATNKGGVIATNTTGNTITINGGDFHNNKAVYGGVIDTNVTENNTYSNTVTIAGGTFKDNTATADGGVIRMGGAKDGNAANTLTISGGEISGNKAVNGGAVYCGGKTNITIRGTDTTHGVVMNNTADMGDNLLLAGEGSALTVAAGGLLYGGATAGDVMFTQAGHVDLCDVSSLYLKPVTDSENLAWLKNQEAEGQTARTENAAAQDCYILTKNGAAPALYAARIGNTYYHSISQAFSAAKEGNDPQTIVLLRDQTENLTVTPLTKEVTLNLNGYTLTGQITVDDGMNQKGGCFILTDATGEKDYKQDSAGGVLTGNNQNKIGIWVKSQNTATENPTVKLQGSLTLTGFVSHAVYVENNGNVTANNVTFAENTNSSNSSGWPDVSRGAAISFSSGGNLVAENCIFSDNSTIGYGGAVYMSSTQATATLKDCTFKGNTSHYGGAVSLGVRNATLTNNKFTNNKVTYGSGYYGGALYLYLYQSDSKLEEKYNAVLRGNTFTGNSTAGGNGGALMLDTNDSEAVVTLLDHNTFTKNTTPLGSGGAVYVTRGAVTLGAGNQFIENESFGSGSAIYMQGDGNTIRTSLYSIYEGEQKPENEADYTLFKGNRIGVNNYAEVNGTIYMTFGRNYTLRYAKFEGNTADTGTVGVYVGGGNANIPDRTVTIDHCTFTGNSGKYYDLRFGGNSAPNSQITVSNVTFKNETISHRDGSVVYLDWRNNLTMDNVTIQNTQGQAHMIKLYGGALKDGEDSYKAVQHTLNEVKVLNNTQCNDVPVYLYSGNSNVNESELLHSGQCNTTMTDCEISGNVCTKTDGGVGAMYIEKTKVTMTGCMISNNQGGNGTIRLFGSSVLYGYGPQSECTLTMEGCTVTGNTSRNAAINVGRRDCYSETLNVVDSTISNNTNTTESGGAVRGSVLSTLNIKDSTLSNNTAAKYGGAVYAEAYDTAAGDSRTNLTNCTITGNKAQYGGGVYLARFNLPDKYTDNKTYLRVFGEQGNTNQSLMIKDGKIEDNTATNNGGGISLDINTYSANYCTMKVQVDGTKITNNRAQLGQDVYAYKADPATKLYLPKASDIAANGRWLNEDTGLTLPDRAVEYDIIQRTYPLTLSAPQKEEAVASLTSNDGEPVTYDSLQEAMDAARDALAKDATAQLTVTLLKDTNSSTLVSAGTNVTLDLGKHSIKGIGGTSALTIEDSTLDIKNGTISGTATDGGALLLRNNANVTLTDTTLTGSRAARYGGAAYITGGADLTMDEGAVITGCEAAWGGAVYVNDGTFTQNSDAKIESCKTFINKTYNETGRGGAVYVEKGTYTLTDQAAVTNCTTQNLGTVYIANYGEFNMTGGEISGNTADYGAGVYLTRGNMTIADGKIAQNAANQAGGGVSQDGGIVLMRGGEISGNTANRGAGWRLSSGGSVLMRGGDITGNNASSAGGGIYQDSGTFTVNGGNITKNEAATGGGLRHANGTFNFQGGSLYGNIAREDGGTGSDIDATNKSGVVNLIAASGMKNEKYNVWRDDRYPYPFTKGYHKTSDKIAAEGGAEGGKYLTAEVSNVNDVKLTADYYGGESTEIASNDMYVESLKLTRQDSGNKDGDDAFDNKDGVITAQDVKDGKGTVEGVTGVTESDKVYPLEYQETNTAPTPTGKYLTVHYSNNKTEDVRPDTPLAWTAGNDSNYTNRLIRSFSTAYYGVELVTKSAEMKGQLTNTTQRLWIRIKVPCEKNDVSIKGVGTTFNSSLSYYDPTIQSMVLEGYQDLGLTKEQANGTTTASQQFTITVGGMHNGETLKPTVEAWFDNSSYNKYQNTYNTAADKVSLDADPMVVSAKAAYNLAIENQPDVKRVGYFDIDQKVEITEKEYNDRKDTDPNVVYGMVAGYGMALQLRNQDADKKLRGIEVPTGDITFNVGMHGGLYFDGKQVTYKEGGEDGGKAVSINPILWAYKPNDRGQSQTGYDTRNNKAGINMYWNDEDDLTKNTAFDPKYPANITADHSGGVWSVDESIKDDPYTAGGGQKNTQTRATFRVSGYNMEPIGSVDSPAYTFSAGYLQVIIPIDLDKYNLGDGESYDGFLQADLRVVADKFKMDGVDADKMNGIAPTIKDDINNYYNFTEDELETLKQHATNETYYKDNYNKSETLGMNITKTEEGNGSFIYKSTYWLGSDGKTVLNDAGKKELGSNVTGVGSQLYMVGNLQFGSQAVTPANDPDRYLYDSQTDAETEYYYLTAFDVLMKFDPDAMEPVVYKEGDEEKAVTRWSAANVKNKLGGISMINLSDTGGSDWDTGTTKLTQNYDLTILYAAKQVQTPIDNGNPGNGWVYEKWEDENTDLDNSQPLWQNTPNTRDNGGTADMDNFSFDTTTTDGNCLVYYNTLADLKAAGKTCVAVLYQVRNCCIRNGREVSVGHMMQVSEDVGKVGRSYATTMDMRAWTTYRPFYRKPLVGDPGWQRLRKDGSTLQDRRSLLYQGLIEGNGKPASTLTDDYVTGTAKDGSTITWNIGQPTLGKPDGGRNCYQKTQYSNGYEVGGSHSGYKFGNTVLVATQNASVGITTTDVEQGNIRQTDYLLDNGQRTVTVEVTPKITMQSNVKKDLAIFDGRTETKVEVTVGLPRDLTLQQGTLEFNYTHSDYKQGDLTWDMKYQYYDTENSKWCDFDFTTNYANPDGYQQRETRLVLTTTITDAQKTLPTFSFKGNIGYPADPSKDIHDATESEDASTWHKDLTIRAEIHSTYEEQVDSKEINAALGREASTTVTVFKNSKSVINKTAQESLVEVGDDLTYVLTYLQSDNGLNTLELCDVLPYDSKAFHGAYALKSVQVEVKPKADGGSWETNGLTLKYGDSSAVVLNDGVLQRGSILTNSSAEGTTLNADNCDVKTDANSVSYTLKDLLVHKATGSSELGTLYFKMDNVPESTVQITVTLTPTQNTENGTKLLTDSDTTTTQQPADRYSNVYFSQIGENNYITSPAASIKVRSRSISGLAWLDQNHDGVYTTKLNSTAEKNVGSDKLLSGITVTLLQKEQPDASAVTLYTDTNGTPYYGVTDTLGNPVQPVETDEFGRYTFANLPEGSYYVLFTDADNDYQMEDGRKPALPFGKLSLTSSNTAATSNKAKAQYGDDDTTLQGGLTDEITLGNAVLTGRDDRSNVNAGFYYTELRLEKVWKNVPDSATAAQAKVKFTLTATGNGNKELNRAVYTMSNTTISAPETEEESLFGQFVTNAVTAEDDTEAPRTVRWMTESGLPLQAENANGPIAYALVSEEIEAKKNWAANATFIQNLTQEQVSSGPDSDNSAIATRHIAENTALTYDIEITKLSDLYGKTIPAGAKFEAKLKNDFTQTSKEVQVTEGEETFTRYLLKDLCAGTYTLRETKAPLGYAKDRMTYTLIITDTDTERQPCQPTITLQDKDGNTLYTASIKAGESGVLTVEVVKDAAAESATVMTGGKCLEVAPESNPPIRTQIDLQVTDAYLFSLPFTGGDGMNRTAAAGIGLMALAAVLAGVVTIRKRKKGRDTT